MPNDAWQKFANLRLLFAWQYAHPGKKLLFMGGEFAQWHEWREGEELDWPLLEDATHRGIHSLVRDLNHLYRDLPALHWHDFEHPGFEWIDCHDGEHSVLSLIRHGDGQSLVCLFNFTPVPREDYRVGLPLTAGIAKYSTPTQGCMVAAMSATPDRSWPRADPGATGPASATVHLPPLGAVFCSTKNRNPTEPTHGHACRRREAKMAPGPGKFVRNRER